MPDPIQSRPTPWRTILLLCGRCSRKLDGGYGLKGKMTLRTALKEALRAQGRRRTVRVAETKCFGLCPKKAVVALNASAPSRLLAIARGTSGAEALTALEIIAET